MEHIWIKLYHDFVDSTVYRCKKCGIRSQVYIINGFRGILGDSYLEFNCEEYIIKNIIE